MHADRINVFHITYRDTVSGAVAHHLVLDLLPARDTTLNQNLTDTGKSESVFQNLLQFDLIMGDTAAGAAQCVRRTKYDRVTDLIREINTVLHVLNDLRRRTGLADALHQILEFLSSLGISDGLCRGSQQCHAVLGEETGLLQLHAEV